MTPLQSRLGKKTRSGGGRDGDGPLAASVGEAATAYTLVGSSRHLRQDRGVETREKLIAAAIEVLSQEGYAAFSTPAVSKAACVSRGALQYHFDSRESLLLAVRTRLAEEMRETVEPAERANLPIAARVAAMVDHCWSVFGSPRYVAALEIRISERFNDDLNQQATRELGLLSDERDQNWLEVFADSPLPRDQLVATRLFMLDVMRGLAVRQIETLRTVSVEPELALLRRMLAADISGETRRA